MPEETPKPLVEGEENLDYGALVRFLIEPFLETPDALRVNCEVLGKPPKTLIRVAFAEEDRGRVFGRGGRNIQAVRTVLKATAQLHQQVAHLDIYGETRASDGDASSQRRSSDGHPRGRRNRPRPPAPRPQRKEG